MSWLEPVRPLRDGSYRLRLGGTERQALRGFCEELRELIEADGDEVARLFPAAYRDDAEASAEYDRLVRDELVGGRLESLRTVEATIDCERLDEAQLAAWCGTLNDLRLVLGERIGVTEDLYETGIDPRDPRAPELALYGWLTWLQGHVVEALSSRLPGA
ncbi:MAG: DUF2017 family protein [Gaiellaceae bacterium]